MDNNELKSVDLQRKEISKPVKWTGYESLRTEHSTNLVVQSQGAEFTFLFFEVQPPFTTGTPEEQATQLQELPYVEAKCVAKIVMSAPNAVLAANVLLEQLGKFNTMMQHAIEEARNAENK